MKNIQNLFLILGGIGALMTMFGIEVYLMQHFWHDTYDLLNEKENSLAKPIKTIKPGLFLGIPFFGILLDMYTGRKAHHLGHTTKGYLYHAIPILLDFLLILAKVYVYLELSNKGLSWFIALKYLSIFLGIVVGKHYAIHYFEVATGKINDLIEHFISFTNSLIFNLIDFKKRSKGKVIKFLLYDFIDF